MTKVFLTLLVLAFLGGCSFTAKPDAWKYKSINAFSSYTKNFLSARDALAKSDLARAVSHAKSSADLTQLSRIYLGECALNISVGIQDRCQKYLSIADLVQNKELDAYYKFIRWQIDPQDLDALIPSYRDFARYKIKNESQKAIESLFEMDKITSKLLAASLIQEKLSFEDVQKLIELASFYGYKKSVLYWLHVQKTKTTQNTQRERIAKKIKVLESV